MVGYMAAGDCICGEVTYTVTNDPLPTYITNPMTTGLFDLMAADVMTSSDSLSEVVSLYFTVEWAEASIQAVNPLVLQAY